MNKNLHKSNNGNGKKCLKWLSAIFMILSIAYIIIPLDYDNSALGYIDDFFIFMAAFCFAFAQYSRKVSPINRRQLYTFSITFTVLAILWILIMIFTPVLQLIS